MKALFFFLFLLALASSIPAQKISLNGIVKDAETDSILPYVNVQVKNTNYGTVTVNFKSISIPLLMP